jgi:L-lactate dehydrogenase
MKIGIVGTGFVGSSAAYAMLMSGIGGEIVLNDINLDRAKAEADDLVHATPFSHSRKIMAGGIEALEGCGAIILTAGASQKPGEDRLSLLQRNAAIFQGLIPQVHKHAPEAILIVTTNPVDIMTHLTAEIASDLGTPRERVFGSGTTLDTARFRSLLGEYLDTDAKHIHGYVIGEHGDSEVLTWSLVTIGGMSLEAYSKMRGVPMNEEIRKQIDHGVRDAAYAIIAGKGATYYGIGAALAHIVDVLEHDHSAILTVCAPIEEISGVRDVTLSMPFLVNGAGVQDCFPLQLSEDEERALNSSASIIRQAIDDLKLSS